MTQLSREDRLWAELDGLRSLKRQSSSFDFESEGEPPETFVMTFRGKGIASIDPDTDEPQFADQHQVQVQVAYLFPDREPDLKWITPVFHPNLSNSGFVDLNDLGLEWNSDLTLEIIAERLWDVIRLAHVDFETATCLEAKEWFQKKMALKLPVDPRPLRDRAVVSQSNVVQYSRRGKKITPKVPVDSGRDVLFIGDEPESVTHHIPDDQEVARPTERSALQPKPPGNSDDDILFID